MRIYTPGTPLGPPTTRALLALYREYGLDPRTTHPRLYESESITHIRQDAVFALFKAMRIRQEHRVLSLGEGNGAVSRLLAKSIGCRVTGVDLNSGLIASARSLATVHGVESRVEYLRQDVHSLRLGERRFDRLLCHETMCHWKDKGLALRRALTSLKPGSLVGIHESLAGDDGGIDDAMLRFPALASFFTPKIWFQQTLDEMRGLLTRLGLKILSSEDLTDAVAEGLRRRLAFIESISSGKGMRGRGGAPYLRAVLPVHGRYLRCYRIIARWGVPRSLP